jgi:hypothetical protein
VQGEGGAAQGEAQARAGVGAGARPQGEGGVGWSGSRCAQRRVSRRRGLEREPTHTAQGKASGLDALWVHRCGSTSASSALREGASSCTQGRGTGGTRQGYEVRIISKFRAHVNESYPMHEAGSAYCGLHGTK